MTGLELSISWHYLFMNSVIELMFTEHLPYDEEI